MTMDMNRAYELRAKLLRNADSVRDKRIKIDMLLKEAQPLQAELDALERMGY